MSEIRTTGVKDCESQIIVGKKADGFHFLRGSRSLKRGMLPKIKEWFAARRESAENFDREQRDDFTRGDI